MSLVAESDLLPRELVRLDAKPATKAEAIREAALMLVAAGCVLPGFEESMLRHAWRRTRLPLSFEAAMQVPALAICLRCLGEAQARRAPAPVQPEHQSRRRPGREQAFSELDLALALPMA